MDAPRADWRSFETAPDATHTAGAADAADARGLSEDLDRTDRVLALAPRLVPLALAAVTGAVVAATFALALAGPGSSVVIVDGSAPGSVASTGVSTPDGDPSQRAGGAAASAIVVDVEGGVARPGLVRLAAGSRVADAIAAAGGYAPSVDVARAASELNLAARVADGERVRIPALGDPQTILSPAADAAGTPDGVTAGGATGGAIGPAGVSGGLVDINRATAEQLDTLPGIGPATAGKILDARAAAPFTRTSDLRDRKVVSAATYAKIEGLITVGP